METQEVARSDWSSFFGAFSRQHESWLVTLEGTVKRDWPWSFR